MTDTVDIRVTVKAQNEILAKYRDKCGSNRNAAQRLGVHPKTFSDWLNFKSQPRYDGDPGGGFSRERIAKLIVAVEKETGRSFADVFPLSRIDRKKLEHDRVYTATVDVARIEDYRRETQERLSYKPADLDAPERSKAIKNALNKLSYRQRKILEMRYGLGSDNHVYSLEDIGHVFKVTKERIRQLEARAIERLKDPLVEYCSDG